MDSLVSVIIPAYNAEETIIECLESVLQQTYRNIEVIIVDDGSEDNTFTLIKEYLQINSTHNVSVLQIRNSGPAYARNYGIEHANGNYIAFLDSDDKWKHNKIEKQLFYLKNNPQVDLLGCGYSIGGKEHFLTGKLKSISKYQLLFKNYFLTPSIIVKRDILERFTFITKRKYSEDYYLWLQIAFHNYQCAILEEPLTILYNKTTFGQKGLSANLWKMEKGELNNFHMLHKEKLISLCWYYLAAIYSILKFCRRTFISFIKRYTLN